MIPLKHFSDYFYENLSLGGSFNQLQITSRCSAKCFFCSNEQNPFEIERTSFRELDEIEKVLWATPQDLKTLHLNESLPGRLSEGEAFLHPKFFDILKLIRKKLPVCEICITTNGSFLSESMLKDLSEFKPFRIQVSFPTVSKEAWMSTFSLSGSDYETAKASFTYMTAYGFSFFSSLTPMPSWLGYEDVEQTVKFLSMQNKRLLVYAPGYTKYTNPEVVDRLKFDKVELSDFLESMCNKYWIQMDWTLDPKRELLVNDHAVFGVLQSVAAQDSILEEPKTVFWFTSLAAHERFCKKLERLSRGFPVVNTVVPVENKAYGGNIECSGLWMIDDIKDVVASLPEGNIAVIPNGFLDRYGFDLKGDNMADYLNTVKHISVRLI